ncbi:MAG: SUMF1/EgtB/PvdO family nonheme iron enzyme [Bacteroidetes bacterium]|nr:SUMF1/EgtB/PvdO family nonheme iron enzyme [Bacteroidota bacterium]
MRRTLLLIPVLLLLLSAFSQKHPDKVRKQPKFKLVPPGTVWLRDSVFIDETEIRNLDWLEYLYWTSRVRKENYAALLPDTLVWKNSCIDSSFKNYTQFYLHHPSYRNCPVAGISYEQAIAFCKWRTDRVNEYYMVKLDHYAWPQADSLTHYTERVRYRLPTKAEWEYAASGGLNSGMYPYGFENTYDKRNMVCSNTKEMYDMFRTHKDVLYKVKGGTSVMLRYGPTQEVYSGKPNSFGIYNLLGNVSELIADSVVKGYNYITYLDGTYTGKDAMFEPRYPDSLKKAYYRNDYKYYGPQPWLGFRCVCEVLQ